MADELITGSTGELEWTPDGGSLITVRVIDWSITRTVPIIDGTDSGSGAYREKEVGKRTDWKGSLTMFLRSGIDDIPLDKTAAATFTVEDTKATITRAGTIIVTETTETVNVEAEEAVKITVNFEGSGALTLVNTDLP